MSQSGKRKRAIPAAPRRGGQPKPPLGKGKRAIPAPRLGVQSKPAKRVTVQVKSMSDEEMDKALDTLFQKYDKLAKDSGQNGTRLILKEMRDAEKNPSKPYFRIPIGKQGTGLKCTKFNDTEYPSLCVQQIRGLIKEEYALKLLNRFKERFDTRLNATRLKEKQQKMGKRVPPSIPASISFMMIATDTFVSIPSGSRLPLISSRGDPELVLGTGKVKTTKFLEIPTTSARLQTQYSEFFFTEEEDAEKEEGVLKDVQEKVEDVVIEAKPREESTTSIKRGKVDVIKKRVIRKTRNVTRK